ncbi:phosphotriesterase [Pseudoclavibacter sp. AY1H1]|uniref:phosphotriesterase family protein n=1 Tax=Pseudoclavibacter sp. AY1H1 TaxID=2080584 RepID=UPI000CE8E06A|nr:phosphotriesterase [Pseudoclavibacter sp. AY1H1]PPF37076.1 phosphotriesterase [Pseudoclavibacter sp. AY1H1]
MTGEVVRTTAGDLDAASLGVVDSHDHLFLSTPALPGQELADFGAAVLEADLFREAGGTTIVQWTPRGLGRQLAALQELGHASRVHIVAATGRHRREVYRPGHPLLDASAVELAAAFVDDVIDRRCGLIKVGTGPAGATPFERTSLDAAAAAHHATGAPIAVHLEGGRCALAVVGLLRELEVAPEAVVLGHLGRNPDLEYIAEVSATGAYLCVHGPSPNHARTDSALLSVISRIVDTGHAGSLLIGGDTTTRSATAANGGAGMRGLLSQTRRTIASHVGDAVATAMFTTNPARAWRLRGSGHPERGS